MPWAMESTRTKLFLYAQFVVFHLGVTAAIGLSFVIPYVPGLLDSSVLVLILKVIIGGAFLVGVMRLIRRISNQYMRAISSPDDYFSLLLLTAWFAFAFLSVPNRMDGGQWHLITYFILTAFFLVYVPFSKISHYLYYPFTRYYLGKTMGHRGIYPIRRVPQVRQQQH
jgi:nitrate reductase gamma subunit